MDKLLVKSKAKLIEKSKECDGVVAGCRSSQIKVQLFFFFFIHGLILARGLESKRLCIGKEMGRRQSRRARIIRLGSSLGSGMDFSSSCAQALDAMDEKCRSTSFWVFAACADRSLDFLGMAIKMRSKMKIIARTGQATCGSKAMSIECQLNVN